jgi:hypothetical protein
MITVSAVVPEIKKAPKGINSLWTLCNSETLFAGANADTYTYIILIDIDFYNDILLSFKFFIKSIIRK